MDKKKLLVALVALVGVLGLLCCGAGFLGYSAPADDAKLVGNSPDECEQSCVSPCFCERSCVLFICWGDYYCQCDNG